MVTRSGSRWALPAGFRSHQVALGASGNIDDDTRWAGKDAGRDLLTMDRIPSCTVLKALGSSSLRCSALLLLLHSVGILRGDEDGHTWVGMDAGRDLPVGGDGRRTRPTDDQIGKDVNRDLSDHHRHTRVGKDVGRDLLGFIHSCRVVEARSIG